LSGAAIPPYNSRNLPALIPVEKIATITDEEHALL
jgi:hypothetical protein